MSTTPEIDVVAARVDWLEALVESDAEFATRFGLPVEEGWAGFPEAVPAALEATRRRSGDDWGTHLFFDRTDGALVGFGGWKGAPTGGEAELGYAVAPARQGRGIATAVVQELLARARRAAADGVDLRLATAHTLPEENASTAVLRRCGFTMTAVVEDPPDGQIWRWERPVQPGGGPASST